MFITAIAVEWCPWPAVLLKNKTFNACPSSFHLCVSVTAFAAKKSSWNQLQQAAVAKAAAAFRYFPAVFSIEPL
jgi:hypothetical protein